jgi:AcrR family transcriptional regulator
MVVLFNEKGGGGRSVMKRKTTTTKMTKSYIAQSLMLLMQEKPYAGISIDEITAKAGVNRSTYYRNFSSKEDIVKFYITQMIYEYRNFFNKNDSFKIHFEKLLIHYLKYKKELLLIYKNGLTHILLEILNNFYKPLMKNKSLSFEEEVKIYWYNGAIYNSFLRWVSNEMRDTPKELSDTFEVILSGTVDYDFFKQPFLVND